MTQPTLTLHQFNLLIKETLSYSFPESWLITAEISSIRNDAKGHCYIDLVEKDENTILAQMNARIWASNNRVQSRKFEKATGRPLAKGLKILMRAQLNFHERYGMSLIIQDIDPTYTLGEMARKRKEIIDRLIKEGLIKRNGTVPMPLVPQRVAVISSAKAAGFEDFMSQLNSNPFGYLFHVKLHESVMQGDRAEASLLKSLSICADEQDNIDIIVIVRGGGSTTDLDCFDSYEIGKRIALMKIPVISGIGHERDRTVVDEVSHTSIKTPTAVAAFIIESVRSFENNLDTLSRELVDAAKTVKEDNQRKLVMLTKVLEKAAMSKLIEHKYMMDDLSSKVFTSRSVIRRRESELVNICEKFKLVTQQEVKTERNKLQHLSDYLLYNTNNFLTKHKEKLKRKADTINHLNPENIFKRGYTITYINGVVLKNSNQAGKGDILETKLSAGKIRSEVL